MAHNLLSTYLKGARLPDLTPDDISAAIKEVVEETSGGRGDITYVNFSGKTGRYSVGRDRDDVDPEEKFIVDPHTLFEGWKCWKSQKVADRVIWPIFQRSAQSVSMEDLPDHGPYRENSGDGWNRLLGFLFLDLTDNAAARRQMSIEINSESGRRAFSDFLIKISDRTSAGEPYIPIVQLGAQEFEAQGQKNSKPTITVTSWVETASVDAFLSGKMTMEELESGKRTRKRRAPSNGNGDS